MTIEPLNLVRIRRQFHESPELALKEFQTHALLLSVIHSLPQNLLEIKTIPELPTALLVRVAGSHPHRTIGYRADIDALPVNEKTGLDFASKTPGIMHACGHDTHMTVALGILEYFANHQPQDNLIFFFQPAEESHSGSVRAFNANIFTNQFRPNEFYGLHSTPTLPAGVIGCRMGTLFAGTTEVNLKLTGKGGHAAYPQDANDMVVAQAYLITQLQTIVARNVNPIEGGVLTLGKVSAGNVRNVIADQAVIEGTIRGLTQKMILLIQQRVQQICEGTAQAFNCQVEVKMNQGGYLPVENDQTLTHELIQFMQSDSAIKFKKTPPAMTGEDFGFLLSKFPGTMFWLGVGATSSLHSATFNPDERAIQLGIDAVVKFLQNRMSKGA